jgi:formylglycine-generating enzyme required for sulfatase activity
MVAVPAGAFDRGCAPSGGHSCDAQRSATPARSLTLGAFSIDLTEVTRADYQRCVAAGGCTPPAGASAGADDAPVVNVTWEQARSFCAWDGKRLPTEAEWEKAARGTRPTGGSAAHHAFPWGTDLPDPGCERAVHALCSARPAGPASVGGRAAGASPHGALDMAGNVAEWVADWYGASYYADAPAADPPGPSSGDARLVRGGSFALTGSALQTWDRSSFFPPATAAPDIGFRCATSR